MEPPYRQLGNTPKGGKYQTKSYLFDYNCSQLQPVSLQGYKVYKENNFHCSTTKAHWEAWALDG